MYKSANVDIKRIIVPLTISKLTPSLNFGRKVDKVIMGKLRSHRNIQAISRYQHSKNILI